MKHNFYSSEDVENVPEFIEEALKYKYAPVQLVGTGKTLVMIFFNSSLRTRLSTEIAARKIGMEVITININDAWQWELEDGSAMVFDTVEHVKDAAKVIGTYADIVAIRAFPGFTDKTADYADKLINTYMRHSPVPVINMESAIRHPLQSLADLMTIREHVKVENPKIVLSWAPHVKALPQAVSNSFLEWCGAAGHEVIVTHPKGYELAKEFIDGHRVEYDREAAFADADVVYVKNWSSYKQYGSILSKNTDWTITDQTMKLTNNAAFMHCLPIRRNLVAMDNVIDSNSSLIYEQAENRLHSAAFVLKNLI